MDAVDPGDDVDDVVEVALVPFVADGAEDLPQPAIAIAIGAVTTKAAKSRECLFKTCLTGQKTDPSKLRAKGVSRLIFACKTREMTSLTALQARFLAELPFECTLLHDGHGTAQVAVIQPVRE